MPKDKLTNSIRQLRFTHGEMTQQELAERAGCTRQTILLLEHNRYSPSLTLAFRIARVFGQTVDEIFNWEGDD